MDFGAGSYGKKVFTVGEIVRRSAVRPKFGKLLFRLSRYFKPHRILELGTSLGISTMYLSLGWPDARVITIEGDPLLRPLTEENFKKLKLKNIKTFEGKFSQMLPLVSDARDPFDMVFIDGDHRGEEMMNYLKQIRPFLTSSACVILDDIHWSGDMEQGWKKAVNMEGVTLSVDLLQFGLIFFDPRLSCQQYTIRY